LPSDFLQHHGHQLHVFKQKLAISLVLTVPILLLSQTIQSWLHLTFLKIPYQNEVLLALSAIIYVYGGLPFLQGAVQEIRQRQLGMMTLVASAISVAFFYSAATVFGVGTVDFFWELATLIDIMLLGHWLEMRSVLGASMALQELARLIPNKAHLLKNGAVTDVAVGELKVDDVVLVRPGEKVPSDGVVVGGMSSVNEALLTGESKPIHKMEGGKVIGGAVNGQGALTVKIEKTGQDTYLAQVVRLVKQAQDSKSRTQDLANRAAAWLFYAAVASGIVTFVVWSLISQTDVALTRTVTVLVIACPHALGLAIPLVVALSTSITAKNGILIRDRKAFEALKNVDAVVFDKTGTLTRGQFGVTDVVSFLSEPELLGLAASVEVNSEHVLAKAIVDYAKEKGAQITFASEFQSVPGKGVFGKVGDKAVYVGGSSFLEELKVQLIDQRVEALKQQGKTLIFVVVDGEFAGAFALADQVRSESKQAIAKLTQQSVRVFMLTGDSASVAAAVAAEVGIDKFFAGVLPGQKASKIRELQQRGLRVAMVGDGINDAPALVTADVGVAIGAGTDVAIESADIILVKNDPQDVAKAMMFSKRTYGKMVQNLWWAAGYNVVAIPLAAGILSGYGFVLPPQVGALIMSLSTVIVAVNAQTLRKYEPKTPKLNKEEMQEKTAEEHMHH
jgi:Cu2+-exporting ATPase